MSKKRNLRKKAVADGRVQYTLARRVVLHFFLFICAGTFFGIINQFLADPFAGAKQNLATFAQNSAPMLVAMICMMPIFVRDTLTLSNKIVGPIHNMRNTISALAEGEQSVRPLRFRKGDFWDDIPEKFNQMTERLRNEPVVSEENLCETSTEQQLVEA